MHVHFCPVEFDLDTDVAAISILANRVLLINDSYR
jgi:hypothetical protein